jgi:hypothetical protein
VVGVVRICIVGGRLKEQGTGHGRAGRSAEGVARDGWQDAADDVRMQKERDVA